MCDHKYMVGVGLLLGLHLMTNLTDRTLCILNLLDILFAQDVHHLQFAYLKAYLKLSHGTKQLAA